MDRAVIRGASKRLFNSQYRIEVAELVGSMDDRFTTQDMLDALHSGADELPWSCVTKELAVLVSVGLVTREGSRTPDGRIPYSRGSGFSSFLSFVEAIRPPTVGTLADEPPSNITPMRRRGGDA
jgi:hypothetical protein